MPIRVLAAGGAVQAAGMIATFVVGILLARGLGVKGYGEYGIALSIIALASMPGELGLPRLVIRETAAATAKQQEPWTIIRWATQRSLIASFAVAVLIIAGILVSQNHSSVFVISLIVGLPLIPLGAVIAIRSGALMGLHEVVKGQVPTLLLRPVLFSILLLVVFWLNPVATASDAMALNVVTATIALLASGRWLRSRLQPRQSNQAIAGEDRWLGSALSMAVMDGFRVLQGQVGILLLGLMVGAVHAGIFRVAMAVVLFVSVPMTLLEAMLSPVFARLHAARDLDRFQQLATSAARFSAAAVAALSMIIFVWGPNLIGFVFGPEFETAYPALAILCVGQIASGLFGLNATILMMTGHEKCLTKAVIAGVVVNLVLAVALIPAFGVVGAALAGLGYVLIWNVIGWREAIRTVDFDTSIIGLRLKTKRAER